MTDFHLRTTSSRFDTADFHDSLLIGVAIFKGSTAAKSVRLDFCLSNGVDGSLICDGVEYLQITEFTTENIVLEVEVHRGAADVPKWVTEVILSAKSVFEIDWSIGFAGYFERGNQLLLITPSLGATTIVLAREIRWQASVS